MGIVLIPLIAMVAGLYLWVVVKGTRWAYGKYAAKGAIAAVVIFAFLPTWDTFANHWYHKNIVCARSDVGLQIYSRIRLPPQYYDNLGRFKEPEGWFSGRTMIDGRYQRQSGNSREGVFPLTKYEKRFSAVMDTKEQKLISSEVDYLTQGGGWWLIIFRLVFSQVDYLSYVRGMIDGISCGSSSNSSVNAAFEQK